jgi:toxin secretion/phage lysis holin
MDIVKHKIPLATVSGIIAAWFEDVWQLIFFAVAVIILVYITGMLAGRANEGINSKRARKGVYKKIGFLLLLALSFLLDIAFNHFISHGLRFQLPFDLPIGLIISAWIVITEAISICENLERLGVHMPPLIMRLLRKTHKEIESEDEKL